METRDNKYLKGYWFVIERAKGRTLSKDTYIEKHHPLPKSIYGPGETVVLTAKEHFLVHYMLWKGLRQKYGTKDDRTIKMANAFNCMRMYSGSTDYRKRYKINAIMYEQLKIATIESQREKMIGEGNNMFGTCAYKIWVKKYGQEEADRRKLEASKKYSELHSGEKNGMYGNGDKISGKKNGMYRKGSCYGIWVKKYGVEEADRRHAEANRKRSEAQKGKPKKKKIV